MRGDRETLDLVVRDEGRVSLVLSAVQLDGRLVLVGALIDTESPGPIATTVEVEFSAALLEGAHIPRETTWVLETGEQEFGFSWHVQSVERPNGYVLQDARVDSDAGELRAFAIEDLAATVGVGLASAIAVVCLWRSDRRLEKARIEAIEKWNDCLERGGKPSWAFGVQGDVSLDASGVPRFRSQAQYQVRCD